MVHKRVLIIALVGAIILAGGILALRPSWANVRAESTVPYSSLSGWDFVFVQPDSYYKIQGSQIRFMGSHFIPGEKVFVTSGGREITSVVADSLGNFTTSWTTIPYVIGSRNYIFTGSSSQIPFKVNVSVGNNSPWIVLSTYYAGAGTPVVISGHQFGANEIVRVWLNGVDVGRARTDMHGNFTLDVAVPDTGVGQWTVRAVGISSGMTTVQPFSQAY